MLTLVDTIDLLLKILSPLEFNFYLLRVSCFSSYYKAPSFAMVFVSSRSFSRRGKQLRRNIFNDVVIYNLKKVNTPN